MNTVTLPFDSLESLIVEKIGERETLTPGEFNRTYVVKPGQKAQWSKQTVYNAFERLTDASFLVRVGLDVYGKSKYYRLTENGLREYSHIKQFRIAQDTDAIMALRSQLGEMSEIPEHTEYLGKAISMYSQAYSRLTKELVRDLVASEFRNFHDQVQSKLKSVMQVISPAREST